MKRIFFIVFVVSGFFSANVYSQQIIWSTVENDVKRTGKQIDLKKVEDEIMTLYSQYSYLYDDTDYDIDFFYRHLDQIIC